MREVELEMSFIFEMSYFRFLATGLVETTTSDIAHPFYDIVVRVVQLGLEDFKIAHFETRWRERNLQSYTTL